LVNFGWDEEHHCAQVIADHTRHEGKTALQWADECRSYQRNLADAQADIAGEVAHSAELATRIKELEALASRLKEQRDTAPYAKCKAVRVASEMTAKELTAALAPLYEETPRGHRVKPNIPDNTQ
jgi:hypothetical protein